MATFYARLSALRGGKKSRYVVQFLKVLFDRNRTPCFTYSILRLILPAEDTDRGNYGIKEKALAKIITEALGLKKEEYERLYHYKNPSYHKIVVGIGDFSICLYDVVLPYLKKTSSLTVEELNNLLDELTTPTSNQTNIFRDLLRRCNAEELKWIARIILKDLKLGIKTDVVLKTFHPEAGDYYNMTNSISETCKKL